MPEEMTLNSRIKDIYETAIGHDLLHLILMSYGKKADMLKNPLIGNMKLKTLQTLTGPFLRQDFWSTFLELVNSEKDILTPSSKPITKAWWKEAVFYQIYPRSFCDSNNDGIGDIPGIISKLDYLKDLGIDAIWLSPVYDSPNEDNGYDIRDYHKILKEFGTMEDFDRLLEEIHKRDMKLIMDLVVNHTSDEHRWFQEALADPESPYRDYYFLFDDDKVPNNWASIFAGSCWKHFEKEHLYGLHLFSGKQMDLNWDNPNVRRDVIEMINWWLDKGIDGFRMDVINYISKQTGLPDGNPSVGNLMGFTGIEHYFYGPHLHEYLRQIRAEAFDPHGSFSVGEMPGLGLKMAQLVTAEERKELDMVFTFMHLDCPGHVRFEDYRYDLNYFRDFVNEWMLEYGNSCWLSVFYNNHDNPRMISKIDPEHKHRRALAALLAVMQFTIKGTPFVYQGDEMGLTNYPFRSMDDLSDVESREYYTQLRTKNEEEEVWKIILAGTRDHARVLLPWNEISEEHLKQEADTRITEIYRQLIRLRKENPALIYGTYTPVNTKKGHFTYIREDENARFLIDCNLTDHKAEAYMVDNTAVLIYPDHLNHMDRMDAYEARIWKL
ncbi:MAG: alpha-glucosidase [Solobacterium sp.]|nr:alpha-glucosidase [Solobacterium sp.]